MHVFPKEFTIKDNRLFNTNTNRYEGMAGDEVIIPVYTNGIKELKITQLIDYSYYQTIPTRDYGTIVLNIKDIDDFKIL